MNRFVVRLAMPALLFQIMAKSSWKELDQPGSIAAFRLGCAAFGPSSMTPVSIAAILTVCVLFGVAVTVVEPGVPVDGSKWDIAGKVGLSPLRNPIHMAACASGVAFTCRTHRRGGGTRRPANRYRAVHVGKRIQAGSERDCRQCSRVRHPFNRHDLDSGQLVKTT